MRIAPDFSCGQDKTAFCPEVEKVPHTEAVNRTQTMELPSELRYEWTTGKIRDADQKKRTVGRWLKTQHLWIWRMEWPGGPSRPAVEACLIRYSPARISQGRARTPAACRILSRRTSS